MTYPFQAGATPEDTKPCRCTDNWARTSHTHPDNGPCRGSVSPMWDGVYPCGCPGYSPYSDIELHDNRIAQIPRVAEATASLEWYDKIEIKVNSTVEVVKGRKVPIGTVGIVSSIRKDQFGTIFIVADDGTSYRTYDHNVRRTGVTESYAEFMSRRIDQLKLSLLAEIEAEFTAKAVNS